MDSSFDKQDYEGGGSNSQALERQTSNKSQVPKIQNIASRWVKTGRELINGIKR